MTALSQGTESLYRKTARAIRTEISAGMLAPGTRMASVRELAEKFKVSRKVIERTLDLLEGDRLILRRPRKGVFVTGPERTRKILVLFSRTRTNSESTSFQLIRMVRNVLKAPDEFRELDLDFLRSGAPGIVEKLRKEHFSAVLLCDNDYLGDEPELEILRELGLPVLIPTGGGGDSDTTGFHSFDVDQDEAVRLAIGHLAAAGFRRIGALGLRHPEYGPKLRCSRKFFFDCLHEHNLEIPLRPLGFIPEAPVDSASLDRFMTDWQRFDAVVCYSNPLALQLYEWCRNHGVRIPDDLGVISFGENFGAALLEPPLTTVHFRADEISRALNRFLRGETSPRGCTSFHPALFIRKSCILSRRSA